MANRCAPCAFRCGDAAHVPLNKAAGHPRLSANNSVAVTLPPA